MFLIQWIFPIEKWCVNDVILDISFHLFQLHFFVTGMCVFIQNCPNVLHTYPTNTNFDIMMNIIIWALCLFLAWIFSYIFQNLQYFLSEQK